MTRLAGMPAAISSASTSLATTVLTPIMSPFQTRTPPMTTASAPRSSQTSRRPQPLPSSTVSGASARPTRQDRADAGRQRRPLPEPGLRGSLRLDRHRTPVHPAVPPAGTNGEAERMVRTLLKEWAYARPFADTAERITLLPQFLDFYNPVRTHWSLSGQPPT
jgi:transposase InsO family protein